MENLPRCPHCGAPQLRPDARFCNRCGQALATAPGPGSSSWLLPALAGVAVVLILLAGALFLLPRLRPAAPAPARTPAATQTALALAQASATTRPTATRPQPTATLEPTATLVPSLRVATEGSTLRVRSGPGHEHPPFASMDDGSLLEVLGRTAAGDWFRVRLPDGAEGWVDGQWVTPQVPLESIPIIEAPPTPTPAVDPHFRVDHATIGAGVCTTLRWDADGIRAVYLNGHGVPGHGAQQVCPGSTQTYVLSVVDEQGNQVDWPLTVTVSGVANIPVYTLEHQGCIKHAMGLGQVKGQVFDRHGQIIVGAEIEVLVEGQPNILPPGRSNGEGWYEFTVRAGQKVRFKRITINGQNVAFVPADIEFEGTSNCYQRVDIREQ